MKIKRNKAINFILITFDNDSCFQNDVKSYLCNILLLSDLDNLNETHLECLTNK